MTTKERIGKYRLIAAAPEMLEALLEVKEQAFKMEENRGAVGLPLGAWEVVLSIISKVEGR